MLMFNIPDSIRFACGQRDQIIGRVIGLPIPMSLLSLAAVLETSATLVICGEAIWDPVALTRKVGGISVAII